MDHGHNAHLHRKVSLVDKKTTQTKFKQDKLYTIRCRINGLELRSQHRSYRKQENDSLRINGNLHDINCQESFWMFKNKKQNQNIWQIVHYATDLVVTIEDYQAKLEPSKQSSNQLFEQIGYISGRIQFKDYKSNGLYLDGILQTNQPNQMDQSQIFYVKEFQLFATPALKNTVFFLDINKNLSIDLGEADTQNQMQIFVRPISYRMNQRWMIDIIEQKSEQKQAKKVYIRSALTELYMVYNKEKDCLIQASYPEEWKLMWTVSKNIKQKINSNSIQKVIVETAIVLIEHVKQKKYLSFDQQNSRLILTENLMRWHIDNIQEGLFKKSYVNYQSRTYI